MIQIFATLSATDSMALAMLCIIAFSLGIILTLLVVMLKNGSKRNKEVDELLDEICEENHQHVKAYKPEGPEKETSIPKDWEKDPDWWKKPSS